MKNVVVKKSMMPIGIYSGIPCMLVDTRLNKKEVGINMTIDEIKEKLVENTQFRDILFIGNVVDLKEIITGMHSLGKKVYIQTELNDKIDVIRSLRNVSFRINIDIANLDLKNLVLLKSSDELVFNIDCSADYQTIKKMLIVKNVITPTIIFKISAKAGYLLVISNYFKDLKMYNFKSRLFVV